MFITYTPFDGTYVGEVDSGRVAIDSIKTFLPAARGGSIITLKQGNSFLTATEPDRLQAKIDAELNKVKPDSLAKPNEGYTITDQDFAAAIGLSFFIDKTIKQDNSYVNILGSPKSAAGTIGLVVERRLASPIEEALWEQLRHAYGFFARGICNKIHFEQIKKDFPAADKVEKAIEELKKRKIVQEQYIEKCSKEGKTDSVIQTQAELYATNFALSLLE